MGLKNLKRYLVNKIYTNYNNQLNIIYQFEQVTKTKKHHKKIMGY
jgi:hypothetical protein